MRLISILAPTVPFRSYDGSDTQIGYLRELHATHPYRVKRSDARSKKIYDRADVETLLSTDDDPAYLCVDWTGEESISESSVARLVGPKGSLVQRSSGSIWMQLRSPHPPDIDSIQRIDV